MRRVVRRLTSLALLAGALGTPVVLPRPGDCAGPSIGNYGGRGGPGMSSAGAPGMPAAGAPPPATLKRGQSASSSPQSAPPTYGYWDGARFVRTPGPWVAPNTDFKPSNQRNR